MSRNKLYLLLAVACLIGYCWLFFQYQVSSSGQLGVCFVKTISGFPCPSCGTTRAVLFLLSGKPLLALYTNPFSYLVAAIMLLSPIWIVVDVLRKSSSLFNFYQYTERFFSKRNVMLVGIALVLINWIWNIQKGL